jgi:hypothetical protein
MVLAPFLGEMLPVGCSVEVTLADELARKLLIQLKN